MERGYSVSIETWGDGASSVEESALWELGPVLEKLGSTGAVASAGGPAGGPGATFGLTVVVDDASLAFGVAGARALEIFEQACGKVGLAHRGIARVEVVDAQYLDRELTREPESFLGVSEIAELLGVSRQRVAELRAREDFPWPVAELAAGPVWTLSSLKRFIAGWPRRPGRPRRSAAGRRSGRA